MTMPLSKEERAFLDAYVYEATHEPFGGPATDDLRRRGIRYADLHGLLTGYHRAATTEGILPFGKANRTPPPSPWQSREVALDRSQAVLNEHTPSADEPASGDNGSDRPHTPEAAAPAERVR
jgi:hypothetical protein